MKLARILSVILGVFAFIVCGNSPSLAQQKSGKNSATKAPATAAKPAAKAPVTTAAKPADKPAPKDAAKPTGPEVSNRWWTQWAGSSVRNNTPVGKNIPAEFEPGDFDSKTGDWKKETSKNIKWVAKLGSQSYGNPVVADDKIWVGTNNGAGWLNRYPAETDLGCLLCFNEADGKFLWQHSSEKLPTGRVHDWPLQGICCAPYVEGKRLWFVTSRGEVMCLDTEGFHDGVDNGPVTKEPGRLFELVRADDPAKDKMGPVLAGLKGGLIAPALSEAFNSAGLAVPADAKIVPDGKNFKLTFTPASGVEREVEIRLEGPKLVAYKLLNVDDKDEADLIWVLDMMKQLGVSQHNMCSCSITATGDILWVCTSNGVDESHVNLPAPQAPSFLAVDKNTGKVLWADSSPGMNILHGQWSSPTYAVLGGVPQVMFAGGDGYLYSFRGEVTPGGKAEMLWKFDANPKESKYILGGRGTRNEIIATPVVYNDLVYLAVGQDPEHGEGPGHLWCIDPTKRGDVSSELAFNVKDLTKPIPHKRLQAVDTAAGDVARPNPNSAVVWHYGEFDQNGDGKIDFEETMHRTCGTVVIKDDLLYISDFSGLFHCLDAKTGKPHWTHDLFAATWGSALIVDGKVYIGDEEGKVTVFKLGPEKEILAENNMGNSVYSTPVVANDLMYIANKTHLFAIENTEEK